MPGFFASSLLFSLPIAGNSGGWFDTVNGVFTAPIAGIYLVSFSGSSSVALDGAVVEVQIVKLSKRMSQVATTSVSHPADSVLQAMTLSTTVSLEAGDSILVMASCPVGCLFQGFTNTGGYVTTLTISKQ